MGQGVLAFLVLCFEMLKLFRYFLHLFCFGLELTVCVFQCFRLNLKLFCLIQYLLCLTFDLFFKFFAVNLFLIELDRQLLDFLLFQDQLPNAQLICFVNLFLLILILVHLFLFLFLIIPLIFFLFFLLNLILILNFILPVFM